jgi:hypothetical protein
MTADARLLRRTAPAALAPALLVLLALLHAALYVWLVPPWQAPDEPTQFEYAALIARLGRIPSASDADAALDRQIADSLVRQRFFEYLVGRRPDPPPETLDDARQVFFMPRQVGSDPPLYFALAAVPIRALAAQPIEVQLLALRLLGALFTAGAVLCTYAAARELCDGRKTTDERRKTKDERRRTTDDAASSPLPPFPPSLSSAHLALAAGLLVALHPMFVFVGVGAGNDGLANLIGAALCWVLLRCLRLGLGPRRAAALFGLALLGVLTKRTLLPYALLLALLGGGLALRWFVRLPIGWARRLALLGALALVLVAGIGGMLASGRIPAAAADWHDTARDADAPRVPAAPGTGRAALELHSSAGALQILPGVAAEWAQNQELRFSARIWTAGGTARGRLAIDFGWAITEVPFKVSERGKVVRVHTFVPLFCPYLGVAIHSDDGTIYADQLRAESDRRPGLNLLANADALAPGVRDGAAPAGLVRYLRLRELAWVWRSGRLLEPPPLGWGLGRIFFVSFWGQFGWMSLPLVGATLWEGALALLCAAGLVGVLVWLAAGRNTAWQRHAVGLLFALIVAGLLFPLFNAYTQTRDQVIQQGRYLFPMLAPIALLLALGWRALTPPRWRLWAFIAWVAWWVLFAAAALALIVGFYWP